MALQDFKSALALLDDVSNVGEGEKATELRERASVIRSIAALGDRYAAIGIRCDELLNESDTPSISRYFLHEVRARACHALDDLPGRRKSIWAAALSPGVDVPLRAETLRLVADSALNRGDTLVACLAARLSLTISDQEKPNRIERWCLLIDATLLNDRFDAHYIANEALKEFPEAAPILSRVFMSQGLAHLEAREPNKALALLEGRASIIDKTDACRPQRLIGVADAYVWQDHREKAASILNQVIGEISAAERGVNQRILLRAMGRRTVISTDFPKEAFRHGYESTFEDMGAEVARRLTSNMENRTNA